MLPFFYFKTEPPDQSSIADDFRVAFDFVKFLLYYSTLYLYLTWKKMGRKFTRHSRALEIFISYAEHESSVPESRRV